MQDKVRYAKSQGQTRDHECHWPGCPVQVPPAMSHCRPHWYRIPRRLRTALWKAFVPGQEITMTPSAAYITVAMDIAAWAARQELAERTKASGTFVGDGNESQDIKFGGEEKRT